MSYLAIWFVNGLNDISNYIDGATRELKLDMVGNYCFSNFFLFGYYTVGCCFLKARTVF